LRGNADVQSFYRPAGNGKTISIKALMHSLLKKNGFDIPSLYVKSAPRTWDIRNIFQQARYNAPCLLIFEDIDTIVTPGSRSYFFNEVDGLENNDGLFMVATTNHLDQLDPGLSSRPSRFDRKYLFPLPSEQERVLYCEYWREKLKNKPAIQFPKKLSPAIASITQNFSFAYLKEAFVATLLVIAGHRSEGESRGGGDDEGSDLDDYELWCEMKKQVKLLRNEMGNKDRRSTPGVGESLQEVLGLNKATRSLTDQASEPPRSSNGQIPFQQIKVSAADGISHDIDLKHMALVTDNGKLLDYTPSGLDKLHISPM